MSEHLLYTKLARYYDVIYRDYLESAVPKLVNAYEECFRRFARREVRRVLDIACGTGGPTIELLRRGYIVTGVDLHEEMIEVARAKASGLGLSIEFKVCDARELSKLFSRESFDAVTMFFTSIAYMRNVKDLARLLRSVKHVLRRGGVFIADSPNPHEFMFRLGMEGGEGRTVSWSVKGLEGEDIVMIDWKEITDWVNCVNRFKRLVIISKGSEGCRTYLMSDELRLYTATEFKLITEKVGFSESIVKCYSSGRVLDYGGGKCGRLLFIAVA